MTRAPLAVITGGAGGIGAACATRFAQAGHTVAILDVQDDAGRALAAALQAAGAQVRYVHCDVASAEQVEAVAADLSAEWGAPDVLVASAALIPDTESVLNMDMDTHERMWRVNYHGTLHVCRSFARRMLEQGGAIVTLGSINSLTPLPLPAYNPGKAALWRLTQLLAVELGRHRIRVNSVAPTYVMTPALQARIDAGLRDPDRMMAAHALDRLPTPDDGAQAIAFLCSPQAACITGVLLPVDAGWGVCQGYKGYAGGMPWDTAAP